MSLHHSRYAKEKAKIRDILLTSLTLLAITVVANAVYT